MTLRADLVSSGAGLCLLAWTLGLSSALAAAPADLVLRGGRIWAGKGLSPATALASRGEHVLAVGSDRDISAHIGPKTRVVELRGRFVVPGFNDAHVHFIDGGFGLLSVDLRDAKDEAEFARRIAAHANGLPGGTWILNGNWDHQRWPSKKAAHQGAPRCHHP